jgi:hypothetical protein
MSDISRIVVEKENIFDIFNTRSKEEYWNKISDSKKVEIKNKLISYLKHAKEFLIDEHMIYDVNGVRLIDSDAYSDTYFRLMIGYGIFGNIGIKSGLYTEASITSDKKTEDHLIGAQKIGETVFIAYCKSGFNNEYMKNVWLYENLYLWMSITVSNKEHNSGNILRNKNTIEEKLSLLHYKNVSTLFYNLKEVVYYKIKDGIDVEKSLTSMRKSKRKDFFSTMVVGESIIQDKENKDILKDLLSKDGLVVKYSEYV